MNIRAALPIILASLLCPMATLGDDPDLLTVAEKSDFRATARHADVVALLDKLAEKSPLARRLSLGRTVEGREIPLIVIADPPVATPQEAAEQVAKGKLLVFAIGNIHAGEVDGKEALPMLARELIGGPATSSQRHPLLNDLIIAFAPIYNADGNERVARDHRPGQIGPEGGMGIRENADGLDLNRDFIKLEAPETRGLVDFLNRWDPAIFIDCHTTNGCFHRYVITYEGPKNPAGDAGLISWCRDQMMPAIARDCESKYGVPCFVYGDFDQPHKAWETYPAHARYGTSYVGLRNRISILSEGYSYARYKTRVLGTRDFVKGCLEYAAAHKDEIRRRLADADAATIAAGREPSSSDMVALRSEPLAAAARVTAKGFIVEQRDGKSVSTGEPKDYEIDLITHFRPTVSVSRPFAYLVPAELTTVVEKLRQHGVTVERLRDELGLDVEVYAIDKLDFAAKPFQKHRLANLEVTARAEKRRIPAGTFVVRTQQRLGSLAVYMLEPASDDGLAAWNFLDDRLALNKDYPILRVARPLQFRTDASP